MNADHPPVGEVHATPRPAARRLREELQQCLALARGWSEKDATADLKTIDSELVAVADAQTVVDQLSVVMAQLRDRLDRDRSWQAWLQRRAPDRWSLREAELRRRIAAEPATSAEVWLSEWAAAIVAGDIDEARRLEGFTGLPPALAWLPDRAALITLALELAGPGGEPTRAAEQLDDAIDLLHLIADVALDDAASGGQVVVNMDRSTRIVLKLAVARILSYSVNPDLRRAAIAMVLEGRFSMISAPSAVRADFFATASAIARHSPDAAEELWAGVASTPGLSGSAHRGTSSSKLLVKSASANVPSQRWNELCMAHVDDSVTCVQESLRWRAEVDPTLTTTVRLEIARLGIAAQPTIIGELERLWSLPERPAAEVVLALVERMVEEHQVDRAISSLTSVELSDPDLSYAVAAVRARASELVSDPPTVLATYLLRAGEQALWSNHNADAIRHLRRSLELLPAQPDTMRTLADALQVEAFGLEAGSAAAHLREALDLCRRAEELDVVSAPDQAWVREVEASAHQQLADLQVTEWSFHLWQSLRSLESALVLQPGSASRWGRYCDALSLLGFRFTADALTRMRPVIANDDATIDLAAAVNVNDVDRTETLLATVADDDLLGTVVRAHLARCRGDLGAARRHFEAADGYRPDILRRLWLAEIDTVAANGEAASTWREVWRDAQLDTVAGLEAACWAALFQGLEDSALELAIRLERAEQGTWSDQTPLLVKGLLEVRRGNGGEAGWSTLAVAVDRLSPLSTLLWRHRLCAVYVNELGPEAIKRLAELFDERAHRWDAIDPSKDQDQWELDYFAGWNASEPEITSGVESIRHLVHRRRSSTGGGASAEPQGSEDQEAVIPPEARDPIESEVIDERTRIILPPSWFAEFVGRELAHDLFRRGIPCARAAESRRRPLDRLPAFRVSVDAECEPSTARIYPFEGRVSKITVGADQWYCPRDWLAAQSGARASAASRTEVPEVFKVPPPLTAWERLTSWSAVELIARMASADTVQDGAESL